MLFLAVLHLARPGSRVLREGLRLGVMIGIGLVLVILGAAGVAALAPAVAWLSYRGWRELTDCLQSALGGGAMQRMTPALATLGLGGALAGTPFTALLGIAATTWFAVLWPMLRTGRPAPLASLAGLGIGAVLISVPAAHLLLLVQWDYGAFAFLFVLINVHDGFSSGFGQLLGRHPLCPQISPKKTWEGAFGGGAVCLLAGWGAHFLIPHWPLGLVLAGSLLVALFALAGDLVASSLKRETGIKDFSGTLPLMGGVLDRFDGLFFITPMWYAFVRLLAPAG